MQVADTMLCECSTNSVPPECGAHIPSLGCGSCNLSQREMADHWETENLRNTGRFIIVSRADGGSLGKVIPFEIEKVLNIAGEVSEIARKSDGTLLVLTKTFEQANKLMCGVKRLGGHEVNLVFDDKKNRCRAVVRDRDMIHWDKQTLLKYLAPQGVIGIENIKTKKRTARGTDKTETDIVPTDSFIITFDFPKRPDILRIGFVDLVTRDYIPEPMRCFKCQRYGHISTTCSNLTVCGNCAKEDHRPSPCTSDFKCVNCGGPHPAYWRICPVFKDEQQVRRIMVEQRISYPMARRIYKSFVKRGTSFARGADTPTGCSTCKCECWKKGASQPLVFNERQSTETTTAIVHNVVMEEDSPATGSLTQPEDSSASKDFEISSLDSGSSGVERSVVSISAEDNETTVMLTDDVQSNAKKEVGETIPVSRSSKGGTTARTRGQNKTGKQRSRSSPGYRSRSRHRKSETSDGSDQGKDSIRRLGKKEIR